MDIHKLDNNIKEALKSAVNALYFNDGSDYESALWEVVSNITNIEAPTDRDIERLFQSLNELELQCEGYDCDLRATVNILTVGHYCSECAKDRL